MTFLVQKFGGTSLQSQDSISKVVSHIKTAVEKDYKLTVVVSALGRRPNPYATDTLLGLIGESPNKREMDMLMACGETIAGVVLANELRKNQISAAALTGGQAGITTTAEFTEAKIKHIDTSRLEKELNNVDVAVVAGFQGRTADGEITTIGRGGSDTTAAALGTALNAEKIEIFTDVNGIMTADPRIVKSARQLKRVTYADSSNLANHGAKVIHPSAVNIAGKAGIPIHVRSTYATEQGTLVTNSISVCPIAGIAHMSALTHMEVTIEKEAHRNQVLQKLTTAGIHADFSVKSSDGLQLTFTKADTPMALELIKNLDCNPRIIENCAKISVVGNDLLTGSVFSNIQEKLHQNAIQILQSADTHTAIGVVVHGEDLFKAMNVLHDTFQLSQPMESGVTK